VQQYNQMGVSWPTGSLLKHSDWLHLRMMDQSQEILLAHAIFTSNEYRITQLPLLHIRLALKGTYKTINISTV